MVQVNCGTGKQGKQEKNKKNQEHENLEVNDKLAAKKSLHGA